MSEDNRSVKRRGRHGSSSEWLVGDMAGNVSVYQGRGWFLARLGDTPKRKRQQTRQRLGCGLSARIFFFLQCG